MTIAKSEEVQCLTGNYAVALAVKQANVDVIAAYPISPQTPVIEKLSEYIAKGELDCEYLAVESEHSAISAAVAASLTGARVFTSTNSQGLLLMHEILFVASALRAPLVMSVANRAISAPINIWCDHGDVMPQRDTGWIQIFVESVQELYDRVVQAFRIAGRSDTLLPVMVNFDGVTLSHTAERMLPLEDAEVSKFTPWKRRQAAIDPRAPSTFGAFGYPDYYYESRVQAVKALEDSKEAIDEADKKYGKLCGREYGDLSSWGTDDAEFILLGMGSACTTARFVTRQLRENGHKVGTLGIRVFRPLPREQIVRRLANARAVGVVDRALTPGGPAGPAYTEMTSLLYQAGMEIPVLNFVAGLGGRDIKPNDITAMFEDLKKVAGQRTIAQPLRYVGLRSGES